MAESNQRRVADPFEISDEDPFAELTRIMGFDPRVPVSKQPKDSPPPAANQDSTPAAKATVLDAPSARPAPAAVATPIAPTLVEAARVAAAPEAHDDFGIDLEKELLGEFADFDTPHAPEPVLAKPAVAFQAPAEQPAKPVESIEPAAADPFGDGFDDVFADALSKEEAPAASEPAPALVAAFEPAPAVEADAVPIEAVEARFVAHRTAEQNHDDPVTDFDFGEFDLHDASLDAAPAAEPAIAEGPVIVEEPAAPAVSYAEQRQSEPDFDFDDLDLFEPSSEATPAEEPAAPQAVQQPEPAAADATVRNDALAEVDMDFSAAFDQEFAAEPRAESPASDPFALDDIELAPEVVQPMRQAPVAPAAVQWVPEPVPARPAVPVNLSLEDELKALLAVARGEPPRAARPVAAPVVIDTPPAVEPKRAQPLFDPRWAALEADEEDEAAPIAAQAAAPAGSASVVAAGSRGSFSDPSLTARHANYQASASKPVDDPVDDLDALIDAMEHEVHAADHHHQPAETAARPESPRYEPGGTPAAASSASDHAHEDHAHEQVERDSAPHPFAGYQEDAPAGVQYEAAPEIETVDVPETAVALADDIDIPELAYDEDKPKAPAYDDIDADFAAAFEHNNLNEEPVNQVVRGVARPTERANFDADFEALYGPAYVNGNQPAALAGAARDFQPAAAGYRYDLQGEDAFDPIEEPATAGRDRFVDLDFDAGSDQEPAPSLAAQTIREDRRPRRGLLVAGVVGGVALLGAVGALALSFGGGEGTETPVVVEADNSPVKVKPENPGGTVVPNQDNKVYDAVKGTAAAADTPVQEKLVTTSEEPVDVAAAGETDALPGVNLEEDIIPKSEDRVDSAAAAEDSAPAVEDAIVVAPRKVKTIVVRSDGTLVPREEAAPADDTVQVAEAPAAPAVNKEATGTVAQDKKAAGEAVPVKKVETKKVVAETEGTPETSALPPANTTEQPTAPKTEKAAAPKTEEVAAVEPAAIATGAWSVQIASQPSAESAKSTYEDLAKRYAGVIGGKGVNIVKAEIAGKGTYWRVRVPARSRDDAVSICNEYKAAGGNCFISK